MACRLNLCKYLMESVSAYLKLCCHNSPPEVNLFLFKVLRCHCGPVLAGLHKPDRCGLIIVHQGHFPFLQALGDPLFVRL